MGQEIAPPSSDDPSQHHFWKKQNSHYNSNSLRLPVVQTWVEYLIIDSSFLMVVQIIKVHSLGENKACTCNDSKESSVIGVFLHNKAENSGF